MHRMAKRFIVGAGPTEAVPALQRLWLSGAATSVDLLGEATVTAAEADRYAQRCDDALRTLAQAVTAWPQRPILEADSHGPIPRVNLSVKVTALTARVRAEAPELGIADAKHRLRALLRTAKAVGAHLHVDMESMDSRDLITELVIQLLNEPEFRDGPSAGIVLQAYLRDADEQLDRLLEGYAAAERTTPLTIRLVKGAYWEHETVEARQHGWTPPVFEAKVESDRNFERLTRAADRGQHRSSARRSPRTTCARSRTRWRTPRTRGTSSSRSCAASATICSRRWPAWIYASARIAP